MAAERKFEAGRGWVVVTVASGLMLAMSPATAKAYAGARTTQQKIEIVRQAARDGLAARVDSTLAAAHQLPNRSDENALAQFKLAAMSDSDSPHEQWTNKWTNKSP